MNAAEVIEKIVKMPQEEQNKVVKFMRNTPNQDTIDAINEPLENLSVYKSMNEVKSAIKNLVHDA